MAAVAVAGDSIQQSYRWPRPYWAEVSSADFIRAKESGLAQRTVAVLPVAAIEQHGAHLPLNVDAVLAEAIVNAAFVSDTSNFISPDVDVLVLPLQAIGLSTEHLSFPGTLSFEPETLLSAWMQIGAAVARAGIKRLLIFNSHGGNTSSMDIVARQLRWDQRKCGLKVYHSSWFNLALEPEVSALFSEHEYRFGIHAGEIETSMMLHLRPDLVDMSLAQNFPSASETRAQRFSILGDGKSAKLGWAIEDYNPSGAVGNAAAADARRGAILVQAAAKALAQLVQEINEDRRCEFIRT